jgi:hypothetical protein
MALLLLLLSSFRAAPRSANRQVLSLLLLPQAIQDDVGVIIAKKLVHPHAIMARKYVEVSEPHRKCCIILSNPNFWSISVVYLGRRQQQQNYSMISSFVSFAKQMSDPPPFGVARSPPQEEWSGSVRRVPFFTEPQHKHVFCQVSVSLEDRHSLKKKPIEPYGRNELVQICPWQSR